jgi:hypothetical protein
LLQKYSAGHSQSYYVLKFQDWHLQICVQENWMCYCSNDTQYQGSIYMHSVGLLLYHTLTCTITVHYCTVCFTFIVKTLQIWRACNRPGDLLLDATCTILEMVKVRWYAQQAIF